MASIKLNGSFRDTLVMTASQAYFPRELETQVIRQFSHDWNKYLEDNFGVKPCMNIPEVSITFRCKDRQLNEEIRTLSFFGKFALLPFTEASANSDSLCIDLDKCPIQSIYMGARSLGENLILIHNFERGVKSELMKVTTLGAFLKKFPQLTGAFANFIDEEINDLPEVVDVDMDAIAI